MCSQQHTNRIEWFHSGAVFARRGMLDSDLVNVLSTAAAVSMAWAMA